MESRKDQLQKQIVEALNANDNDLYSLLKSQWAHRFGVESLDELNNLDLKQMNQNSTNVDNQKIEQSPESLIESDKPISIKDGDNQKEEVKNKNFELVKEQSNESFQVKSNQIVDKGIYEKNAINEMKSNQNQPIVNNLIPLPPKPKYGYLKKWLLRK